ncbi:hypothetical protein [Arsenicibacter rosenii]|uniref:Uncharacterized protein n=1 Tax=Arsenicibacter rosenii TaxID=1750698 RepID=A0A1S2VN28_9BACT|nr:hypothetical protein [Arsenicibacter rosenii]OIN60173.1 hypothetical protein BLX24_04865 [Arsenicibacter rosenii]
MHSFLIFLFTMKVALCSCKTEVKQSGFTRQRSFYEVSRIGQLTNAVNECSGIVYRGIDPATGRRLFWAHNDSGGRPVLYGVTDNGQLVDSLVVAGATNTDWEDIAAQDATTVFIGDIGNNAGSRERLTIYRQPLHGASAPDRITFRYADSEKPADPQRHNRDSEALICFNGNLYVFSKNRSGKFVRMYRMPAGAGTYEVSTQDSVYLKSMVTGGAISPDGKQFALVSYGKVFLFGITSDVLTFKQPLACLRIPRGQTEAICYVSPTELVMANEKGKLFLIRPKR